MVGAELRSLLLHISLHFRSLCCIRTQPSSLLPSDSDEKQKLSIPVPSDQPLSHHSRPTSEFSEAAQEIHSIFRTAQREYCVSGRITPSQVQHGKQDDGSASFSPQRASRCSEYDSRSSRGRHCSLSSAGYNGYDDPKIQARANLGIPVSEQAEHPPRQRAQLSTEDLDIDEASHIWERALQAHAFELGSGRTSSTRSKLGHRSVSPGILAVRLRASVRPRSSLTIPSLSISRSKSQTSGKRSPSYLEYSPTLLAGDLKTNEAHWTPTVRRRRSFPAWSRFPSHTRDERTGAAGAGDGIATKDFAYSFPTLPHDRKVRANKMSSKLMSFFQDFKRQGWMSGWHIRKSDWRRYEKGVRSSIASGGVLSHPELEMLPQTTTTFNADTTLVSQQRKAKPQQTVAQQLLSDYTFGTISQSKQDLYEKDSTTLPQGQDDGVSPFDRLPLARWRTERNSRTLHPEDAMRYRRSPAPSFASSTASFESARPSLTEQIMGPKDATAEVQQSSPDGHLTPMNAMISNVEQKPSIATFRTAEESMGSEHDDGDVVPERMCLSVIPSPLHPG